MFVESATLDDHLCEKLTDSANLFFCISITLIHVHPWLKQRHLYKQPPLQHLNAKFVKVMSTLALVITVHFGLFIGRAAVVPRRCSADHVTMQFVMANNEAGTKA